MIPTRYDSICRFIKIYHFWFVGSRVMWLSFHCQPLKPQISIIQKCPLFVKRLASKLLLDSARCSFVDHSKSFSTRSEPALSGTDWSIARMEIGYLFQVHCCDIELLSAEKEKKNELKNWGSLSLCPLFFGSLTIDRFYFSSNWVIIHRKTNNCQLV